MANRLSEAAQTGNVGAFQNLLREKPLVLVDFTLTSPDVTPLHIATKAGQLDFVREIIKHKPELARESNQEGFRPMDIASALGYVQIVTELMRIDPEICRLRGRDGRTALHYAAINGRVKVISELLSTCGESINDVTSLEETALHLAVKYCKFEAFGCLINWLNHLHMEELVNKGDRAGNTVLHISVSRKQFESVEFLLNSNNNIRSSLELNAMNSRGLTAMDIMDIVTEGLSDIQLREVLQCAGALKACDNNGNGNVNGISQAPSLQQRATNQTNNELLPAEEPPEDWLSYFKFKWKRDSPSDTRNALLVVAALITTVTFQAGLSPPSSLHNKTEVNSIITTSQGLAPLPSNSSDGISVGLTPSSTRMMTTFKFMNTLALFASFSIIGYLTAGFPFQRELQVSVFSMMFAYSFAVASTRQDQLALYIAISLPFLFRYLPRWAKMAWKALAKRWSSRDQVVQGA